MRASHGLLLCVCALSGTQAFAPANATAAGGQIGTTTVYPGAATNPAGLAQAYRFTAAPTGAVDRLNFYLDSTNTARRVEIGLYTDPSTSVGALLGSCVMIRPRRNAWNSCTIGARTIAEGTDYWLAFVHPAGSRGTLKYREAFETGVPNTYPSFSWSLSSLPAL